MTTADTNLKKLILFFPFAFRALSPNANILIGNIYNADRDYDTALKYYKMADEISPNIPSIMILSANIEAIKGNLKEALTVYRKACELSPKDSELKIIYFDLINDFINKKKELNNG